jgi:hypothetical protein
MQPMYKDVEMGGNVVTYFRHCRRERWLHHSSSLQPLLQLLACQVQVRLVARVPSNSRNRRRNWWDPPRAGSCSSSNRTSILCSAIRCSSRS